MNPETYFAGELERLEKVFVQNDFPLLLTLADFLKQDSEVFEVPLPTRVEELRQAAYIKVARHFVDKAEMLLGHGDYLRADLALDRLEDITSKGGFEAPSDVAVLREITYKLGVRIGMRKVREGMKTGHYFCVRYHAIVAQAYARKIGLDINDQIEATTSPLRN